MRIFKSLLAACMLLLSLGVVAQGSGSFVPDMLELDGSAGVAFSTHPILDLSAQGTLEFWVAADWQETPADSPTVLSNLGADGTAYTVTIAPDRRSIALQTADRIVNAAYDFSDGALHHVAFINFGEEIVLAINGRLIASFEMALEALPTEVLWIGANAGGRTPFEGVIAGVRIWRSALMPDVIADYALRPLVTDADTHPEINALVGRSAFKDGDFVITEAVLIPPLEE